MDPTILRNGIFFLLFCLVVIFSHRIFLYFLKRLEKKNPGRETPINAIRIIARIFVVFIIIMSIFTIFDIASPLLISLSSISGIILGFASSEIVTQIISGIYLITARPFVVDDLVNISGIEGLVVEINLNHVVIKQFDHTLMQIPNKKILDAQILNFTIRMKDEIEKKYNRNGSIDQEEPIKRKKDKFHGLSIKNLIEELSEFISLDKIIQYTFELEFEFDKKPSYIENSLEKICEQYKQIYEVIPKFEITNFDYRLKVRFWVFAQEAQIIMNQQNNFVNSIASEIYKEVAI